ncbi:hypothetical protein DUI87_28255 [Hirundo rustica rustica]|uniref:Uncharacterized protein n=1 Tax=Hirundo rustica rustica TaxID=333673 RepID=A0A3M0J2Z3_HIRRU|nr:hypothetical protein DUI87_28255 [Hirundo rustica rustica]
MKSGPGSSPVPPRVEGSEKPGMARFLGEASPGTGGADSTGGRWPLFAGSWPTKYRQGFLGQAAPSRATDEIVIPAKNVREETEIKEEKGLLG